MDTGQTWSLKYSSTRLFARDIALSPADHRARLSIAVTSIALLANQRAKRRRRSKSCRLFDSSHERLQHRAPLRLLRIDECLDLRR